MGSLRTFLALTVVLSHSYGYIFVGGRLAVQLFYIISGFLISYILLEANSYRSLKGFLVNLIAGLTAYCFFPKKPSLKITPLKSNQLSVFA